MLLKVVLLLSVAAVISAAEYNNLGCWKNRKPQGVTKIEGSDKRVRGNWRRRKDAINKCYEVAKDQGYEIFAVGNKGKCWAGNGETYKKYGKPRSCPKNGKGRYGVINAYGIVAPTTTTTTTTTTPPTTTTTKSKGGKCGGHIWESSGTIQSPGFPHNYTNSQQCTWVIYATDKKPIRVTFSDFNLESHKTCGYDYLEVRNGGSPRSPLIGKYCGSDKPYTFSSNSDAVFIRFVSDNEATYPGFSLDFDTDSSCYKNLGWYYAGSRITTSSGTLCQRWDATKPHQPDSGALNTANFPGSVSSISDVNNYCRNPGGATQPWCYTTDPEKEWDYCGVKKC